MTDPDPPPHPGEQTLADVPELRALRLATVSGDGSTTLVSLAHRVVVADFDGEQARPGIPHVHLDHGLEQEVGRFFWGHAWSGNDEGFPGWPAVFAYIEAHPDVLDHD